jgi:diguanylate cyclase
VAEGIEDAETASLLSSLGPIAGQGYYFCRPLPSDALEHWLVEQRQPPQ